MKAADGWREAAGTGRAVLLGWKTHLGFPCWEAPAQRRGAAFPHTRGSWSIQPEDAGEVAVGYPGVSWY